MDAEGKPQKELPKAASQQPTTPAKKPLWRTPTVITMSMEMTDNGGGTFTDGAPHVYHS
jgi:hypothetical protein